MFSQFRCQLAKLISPRASIPVAGNLPQVQLLSPPVPVANAAGPGTLTRGNPADLDEVIKAVAVFRKASPGVRAKAVAALPGRGRSAPRAATPPPALDDDGVAVAVETSDDTISKVIKTLEDAIADLKSKVPIDDADKGEEASALAAKNSGRLTDAVDRFSALALKLQAKVTAKKFVNPLLAEKSSPQRAHKLTASGFNADPVVSALNSQLGRGGSLTLADRAGMTLAPIGGTRTTPAPPAVAPIALSSGYRDRVQANLAESKSLDMQMRKSGVYDAKSLARQAELKAEYNRLMAANSPHRRQ